MLSLASILTTATDTWEIRQRWVFLKTPEEQWCGVTLCLKKGWDCWANEMSMSTFTESVWTPAKDSCSFNVNVYFRWVILDARNRFVFSQIATGPCQTWQQVQEQRRHSWELNGQNSSVFLLDMHFCQCKRWIRKKVDLNASTTRVASEASLSHGHWQCVQTSTALCSDSICKY